MAIFHAKKTIYEMRPDYSLEDWQELDSINTWEQVYYILRYASSSDRGNIKQRLLDNPGLIIDCDGELFQYFPDEG